MVLIRFEPSVTHRCTSVCNSHVDSRVYSVFYNYASADTQETTWKSRGKVVHRNWSRKPNREVFFFFKEEKWESEAERQRERHIMKLCSAASMTGSNLQIKDGLICHPSAGESPQWEWEASASQPTLTTTVSQSACTAAPYTELQPTHHQQDPQRRPAEPSKTIT